MSDGAPISQEIRLPTNVADVMAATAKLDELIRRTEKLGVESEHHHKKSEAGWRGVGESIAEAKHKATEFFEFVGAVVAFEMLEKLADKFAEVGKEAVTAAAMAERMNFAIDAVSGGKEGGENVRKFLEANAKVSEFTEAQNESAYLSLRRRGVDKDKAGLYMNAAEDIAAVSAPEERTAVYQQTLEALARVHSQGRISARGAMQLGITVDDLKTQPGFKGLTNQQVWQKAEKSNLDENTIMALIMRHTGEKAIGERAVDASQLLLTRMSKLSELPERFYKKLGETSATKKLAQEIDVILEKLDPDSPTGKRIFGALESAFQTAADVVGEIDFQSLADTITDDVVPAVKSMISLINPTLEFLEREIRGFHVLHDMIVGAAPTESTAMSRIVNQKWGQPVDELAFLKKGEGKVVTTASGESAHVWHGKMHMVGEDAAAGFAAGIKAGVPSVSEAAAGLGESSHASLMESIDAHSPSRTFAKVGGFAAEGYAIGIEQGSDRIDDAMASTFQIPASGFTSAALPSRLLRGDTNLTVTVNVVAAQGQDEAVLGQSIAAAVRREVTDLLDRTGDE